MAHEPGRVMGIDFGTKRVGIALSDPLRVLAGGGGTLERTPDLLARIGAIIREHEVTLVVVGMPFAPDGGRGAMGDVVHRFVDALRSAVGVPVDTWDESFTSADARRAFIDAGMKRKKRRQKARTDEMAARLLLQGYLESTHRH